VKNQSQVIVYDQGGGGMAARAWWLMRWIGHDAVAVVDGGWAAWCSAGLPTDNMLRSITPSVFIPAFRDHMTVSTDEISRWAMDDAHSVVDSRESRRFTGEEETIDPVAGHIPGAVNRPFGDNLRADGKWRSPEELRTRFQSLPEQCQGHDIAFYCGSGVTACHNILAYKHAGLGDARLYAGSWSEWITNPSRVIATGAE
jgi:thiosulfate/3-mercaptopyruvate sulfurtransferase